MWQSIKRKLLNRSAYFTSYVKLLPILKNIDQSSLYVDCGANIGDISALFLSRGAKVIAFEPDLLAFSRLQKRFSEGQRIDLINKAVADSDGKAMFYYHKERLKSEGVEFTVSSSLLREKINVDGEHGIEVEIVDLCKYIDDLGRKVDILKMDIEGEEIAVLNKMIAQNTYNKVGLILVETHETKIPGHREKVAALKRRIHEEGITNIKLNWI